MRVLYLVNASQIGGGNRSLQTLWQAIGNSSVEALAVCPSDGPMVELCRGMAVPVKVFAYAQPSWQHPITTLNAYLRWRRLLLECKPDIVHANDFSNARSVAIAAWSLQLPLVCHVQFHASESYLRWVFRFLPKPSAFIYNSHATLALCQPVLKEVCPHSRHVLVHNCVDTAVFKKHRHRVGTEGPRVGIVGNLIAIKGHRDFLEMARILTRQGIRAEYWIVGEDIHGIGYRRELEQSTDVLGLKDRVKFFGFRTDVRELLQQIDVLVVASHEEPFGIVSVEGMACEIPVVGTRVGGIPEVIEDGVTGFVVAPRSPHELASKVAVLLGNLELRRRMGTKGRARAEHLFSSQTHARRIISLYSELLTR